MLIVVFGATLGTLVFDFTRLGFDWQINAYASMVYILGAFLCLIVLAGLITTRELAKRACFDCHSNETTWPWYTHIAPMSMLIQRDVDEGRKVLNFSEWQASLREEAEIEAMIATISKGQMPLPHYLILHPEARLTDSEKGRLINGLIATLGGDLKSDHLEEGGN